MLEIKYLLSSLCQKKFADLWLIASFLLSCYMDVETLDSGRIIYDKMHLFKMYNLMSFDKGSSHVTTTKINTGHFQYSKYCLMAL